MSKINTLIFLRKFIGFMIPFILIGSLLLGTFSFYQKKIEKGIKFSNIVYIESSDGYVNVYTIDKQRTFVGESFEKFQEKYDKLLPIRKQVCQSAGCKISVNPEYACYNDSDGVVHLTHWDKSIAPSRELKPLVDYNLSICAE